MSTITIYHNPKCSKSRQTLDLVRQQGIEPNIIEYLKTPPTSTDIKQILKMLNIKAIELVRTKETDFCHIENPNNQASVIKAMIKYPKLIERPIVINGNKAAIGRPPENILAIL